MNAFYTLCIAAAAISLIGFLANAFFSPSYRCSKCGYETNNRVDARIHEKLENTHKMVIS